MNKGITGNISTTIQNRTEGLFPYKHIIYKYMWSSHYWLLTQNNIYIYLYIYIFKYFQGLMLNTCIITECSVY